MRSIEELVAGGFVATTYEDQVGEIFYLKKCLLGKMPAAKALLDEHLFLDEDMVVLTEIIVADDDVQFYIPDADYHVGPYSCNSEEGRDLIEDALASEVATEE